MKEEPFDLVVLSVGMEVSPAVQELGRRLELEMDEYGFCRTLPFRPLETSKPGVYAVAPSTSPRTFPNP